MWVAPIRVVPGPFASSLSASVRRCNARDARMRHIGAGHTLSRTPLFMNRMKLFILSLCRGAFATSDTNHPWPFERLGRAPCARWAGQKRAARFTPALVGHGVRTALGCHCRGADCASRSSILPTAVPVRGVGAGEPDRHIVHALVARRVPRPCGYWTAPRLRRGKPDARAAMLPRWRALPVALLVLRG